MIPAPDKSTKIVQQLSDPVIIGRLGENTFLVASRADVNGKTEIPGDISCSYWSANTEKWSPVMTVDILVRFIPFEYYRAELADHGLTYPPATQPT